MDSGCKAGTDAHKNGAEVCLPPIHRHLGRGDNDAIPCGFWIRFSAIVRQELSDAQYVLDID
jgi:hypothetical protein